MSRFESTRDPGDDVVQFATENREFLSQVLTHGDPEARGYVLAVLAHGGTVEDIEAVEAELEKIKREKRE